MVGVKVMALSSFNLPTVRCAKTTAEATRPNDSPGDKALATPGKTIWEFPRIRGPNIDPNIRAPKQGPYFLETSMSTSKIPCQESVQWVFNQSFRF